MNFLKNKLVVCVICPMVILHSFGALGQTAKINISANSKDGQVLIGTSDKINFYATVVSGKITRFSARSSYTSSEMPLHVYINQRKADPVKSNVYFCEVCFDVMDQKGNLLKTVCYNIDCSELLDYVEKATDQVPVNTPPANATGTFELWSTKDYQVFGNFIKGRIVSCSAKSSRNAQISADIITVNTEIAKNDNVVHCYVRVCQTNSDGTICKRQEISCNKVLRPATSTR